MGSLQLCTPVGSVIMYKFLIASCLAGLPSVDTDSSPPAMAAVPILLSLLSMPLVRGVLRLILTMDTDTDTLVWDRDTVWDTTVMVLDTTAVDIDMDTDTDTTDKMEAFNCVCAIVISTLE